MYSDLWFISGLRRIKMTEIPRWSKPYYRDIIKSSVGTVLINSADSFDVGYETMVFKCDETGHIEEYLELDRAIYASAQDMAYGHQQMIDKWIKK